MTQPEKRLNRNWSGPRRLGMVALPAALATALIFVGMGHIIKVDDVAFDTPQKIVLGSINPKAEIADEPRNSRAPVERIETVAPPPKLAERIDRGDKASIPPAVYKVPSAPPIEIPRPTLADFRPEIPKPLSVIRQPAPVYPRAALADGLEGACDLRFDVDPRGKPFNVTAECSASVFERAAIQGLRKAEFALEFRDGQPVTRRNVVFPLEFRLSE